MGFVMEQMEEQLKGKELAGKRYSVAVSCWFTDKGRVIPRYVQYEDEQGESHLLQRIAIKTTEQKYYAGIPLLKFDCSVVIEGQEYPFILLYHPKENSWEMLLPEDGTR